MTLCACGCGEEIDPQPHHKYRPPRYKRDHFALTGLAKRGLRMSARRLPNGTPCACGCGTVLSEYSASGAPRYRTLKDGRFFAKGHGPRGKGGPGHHLWKGGRLYTSRGYVQVYMPDHPDADRRGYVLEHRLIWEQSHGRPPQANEHVHHINGDKADNRPENLVALTNAEHQKAHGNVPSAGRTREQHQAAGRRGAEARWGKGC